MGYSPRVSEETNRVFCLLDERVTVIIGLQSYKKNPLTVSGCLLLITYFHNVVAEFSLFELMFLYIAKAPSPQMRCESSVLAFTSLSAKGIVAPHNNIAQ